MVTNTFFYFLRVFNAIIKLIPFMQNISFHQLCHTFFFFLYSQECKRRNKKILSIYFLKKYIIILYIFLYIYIHFT